MPNAFIVNQKHCDVGPDSHNRRNDSIQLIPEDVICSDNSSSWLCSLDPVMVAFADLYGPALFPRQQKRCTIYKIHRRDQLKLAKASEELHVMFLCATEHVLMECVDTDPLLHKFNIPDRLWPIIRRSWKRDRTTISGRFDIALGAQGPKVYEYNADSAAALVECGLIQDRWSKFAMTEQQRGDDVGDKVFQELVETWRAADVQGTLHLMCDDEPEERLHTLYMRSAAEEAGIPCRIIIGVENLQFGDVDGVRVVKDADGLVIRNVWKTWSWMTVLARIKETKEDELPDLPDVLLHPNGDVRVWEPLWTIISSSKALLPVLCKLYPNHPLLLSCGFAPSSAMLRSTGFAVKPVYGRCGENVTLIGPNARFIEERLRRPTTDTAIYQELYLLPRHGAHTVQLSCFVSRGRYIGMVLRVESTGSHIINQSSECIPLRVMS